MAEYLCRCCGAALDVNGQITVCKCAFCGVLQTIPRLDFDEKAILWGRADKLLRAGEYDRAEELYDELLKLDDTDSEIYWCKVLCRYGIEYVEERGKHVPTINRFRYKPILDDDDYRAAVNIADGDRRRIYILQMTELEELRKKALAVSQSEKPYDIFICYKESGHDGRRTEDSVLAAEIYRALVADGYRVFFARVVLEDKIGSEYEPYIFSAINSAKVMLAVGTSPDNFAAPWVKNEWSRYLTRISESGDGTLAVLYRDMRREDLPREFAHLQAMDMSMPDFTEELLRGVRRIFSENSAPETEQPVPHTEENAAALLRRAEILLDEGEYSRAEELCENALNLEPENAKIYYVKLLAGFRVKTAAQLADLSGDLEQSSNYRMIMRFGGGELKSEMSEYRKAAAYRYYSTAGALAETEPQYQAAEKGLRSLDGYKDSAQLADKLRDKSSELREKSAVLARQSVERAEKERKAAEEEQLRLAAQRETAQKRRGIFKKTAVIAGAAAVVIAVSAIIGQNISLSQKYKSASAMSDEGDFDGAEKAFAALGNYSDSRERVLEMRYLKAAELVESGDYENAQNCLMTLGSYSNSKELLDKIKYETARQKLENGEFDSAYALFYEIRGYSDSREMACAALYQKAEKLLADGKTEDAESEFLRVYEYSDSADRVRQIRVDRAVKLIESGQLEEAVAALKRLDGEDAEQMRSDAKYMYAEILETEKNYDEAIAAFESISGYKDSAERAKKVRYDRALGYINSGDLNRAEAEFKFLGDYADSADYVANMDEIRFRHCNVGEIITFGNFKLSLMEMGYTGDFDIDWKVIKRDGTRVLAVSREIIDVRAFGGENWSESALRQWLNNDFYNACFTDAEKAMIPTVTVVTPDNESTKVSGGPDTEDKVFIPSSGEVFELLSSERYAVPAFSEWALEKFKLKTVEEQSRFRIGLRTTYWWTRTPGHLHDMTYINEYFGAFDYADPDGMYGVRPAIWIEMGE
ncbi:MAG: DUF6273 domain-containing protein [Lachnospiraceae bacterium]|nr:DUF6273 domain-containing protein [Ruminococcus sp.]MCM1275521.1 DUF6273 domain-containing protein [Lachnospiraceae bacterium]